MKIGILGSGPIGGTLAMKLAETGHAVKVANSRGPDTIDADVLSTGAHPVTKEETVVDVDVLILSIPFDRIPALAPLLADLPSETTVIDTSNYIPVRDERIEAIEKEQPDSAWVVERLGRPVAKAWNSIYSVTLKEMGQPAGNPERIAAPVAADRDRDREVAMTLVEASGFDAHDAGSIAESCRQQCGAPATEPRRPSRNYPMRWPRPISRVRAGDRTWPSRCTKNVSNSARIPVASSSCACPSFSTREPLRSSAERRLTSKRDGQLSTLPYRSVPRKRTSISVQTSLNPSLPFMRPSGTVQQGSFKSQN